MKVWNITSQNILLSGDGENTNSLQFSGVLIKFSEEGNIISVQADVSLKNQPGLSSALVINFI